MSAHPEQRFPGAPKAPAVPRAAGDSTKTRNGFFIPDLCSAQAVLLLVLVGELLALVLTIGASGLQQFSWERFGALSLFVQWTALLSAAVLCQLRKTLATWPRASAAGVGYGAMLAVAVLVDCGAQWVAGPLMGAHDWHFDFWQLLDTTAISAVLGGIALRYLYVAQQLRERQRAELEARVEALQARIRPHFLFNTMNSIASLIGSDPAAAESAVEDLATLFRASLAQRSAEVTIADEVALCRRYLRIEQLRLGDRLQVEWQMDAVPAGLPIPSLSVQPLLENAIYHGIQVRPQGGCIRIVGEYSDRWVRFAITNPLPDDALSARGGNRMALDNIAHRLQALYGADAGVDHSVRQGTDGAAGEFVARLHYRVPRNESQEQAVATVVDN
jgi:two-component system, LytTR family, sensor histidine kinase AlgZ